VVQLKKLIINKQGGWLFCLCGFGDFLPN